MDKCHNDTVVLCALVCFGFCLLQKLSNICIHYLPLSPVPGVLYAMAIALNPQEKQDFLVGVEEKFIFHILFQTQAFSFFFPSFFLNHSRSMFVSLLQLCSAEEWPWGQWHHTKRLAWPWPEPLLAPLVRLNGGWFHSWLTHYGLLQSLSQICGWNVGKHNYARCTWCWLLTKDGNERECEQMLKDEKGSESNKIWSLLSVWDTEEVWFG